MKFINLSGKRLMTAQLIAISDKGAEEICETYDDRSILECEGIPTFEDYADKADKIVDKFKIQKGDIIHVNGLDINLIIALKKISTVSGFKCIYSKMKKEAIGFKYVTSFLNFIEVF